MHKGDLPAAVPSSALSLSILTRPQGNCKKQGFWGQRDSSKPLRGDPKEPRTFHSQETHSRYADHGG